MTDDSSSPDKARSFAVRILPVAVDEIDAAATYVASHTDVEHGELWREGLRAQIKLLATSPRQFALISEARIFRREVRHVLYRRTPSSTAYRILFTITDAGEDGPVVTVFHVRHAARRPITAREARGFHGL
jgi:plasmid stabilization system protein ParE